MFTDHDNSILTQHALYQTDSEAPGHLTPVANQRLNTALSNELTPLFKASHTLSESVDGSLRRRITLQTRVRKEAIPKKPFTPKRAYPPKNLPAATQTESILSHKGAQKSCLDLEHALAAFSLPSDLNVELNSANILLNAFHIQSLTPNQLKLVPVPIALDDDSKYLLLAKTLHENLLLCWPELTQREEDSQEIKLHKKGCNRPLQLIAFWVAFKWYEERVYNCSLAKALSSFMGRGKRMSQKHEEQLQEALLRQINGLEKAFLKAIDYQIYAIEADQSQ
ncbi:MAG: hypothetical protein K0S07_556 [Chlamydiales bacterium]|jgi:hypothetical protein|nr:hypothetical protein [Chlamydiales bacterium]